MTVNSAPLHPRPSHGQIQSIQALRAIAALFVVAFHGTVLWHDKFAPDVMPWQNGNAGVDLFFVISGFIMVVSSRRLLGVPGGWGRFMVLRLVRIVPMYWLVTAAKLAAIVAVPALALHTSPTAWNIVASFLFVPARDAMGVVRPVLDVGWTLSFEMVFYIAFATALFFAAEPILVAGPAMVALALLTLLRGPDGSALSTLANPMVLEFVSGMPIAHAVHRRFMLYLASPWTIVAALAGLMCLAFMPIGESWSRTLVWGLAATVALAACVLSDKWLDPFLPRLVIRIGEASYSLYLIHGFILPPIGVVAVRTKLAGNALGAMLIVSSLVASTAAALIVYRYIEVPMTAWLRDAVTDRHQTNLASPRAAI